MSAPVNISVDLTTIMIRFDQLEALMATAAEEIAALSAKVDAQFALVTDIASDFAAFVAVVTAERENLTAAGQAALDEANAKVDATTAKLSELDTAVGEHDGEPPTP